MAVYLLVVYIISRPFGAGAQAGFGIGLRIIQALFMPVVALGFAVAPVAGQNFGARKGARVIQTFREGALMASGVMLVCGVICHLIPGTLIGIFSNDPEVIAVGSEYLRISSWNFIASGVIFVASSTFQAMGNTLPALATSTLRIVLVAIPAFIISRWPGFRAVVDLVPVGRRDGVSDDCESVAAPQGISVATPGCTRAWARASPGGPAGDCVGTAPTAREGDARGLAGALHSAIHLYPAACNSNSSA